MKGLARPQVRLLLGVAGLAALAAWWAFRDTPKDDTPAGTPVLAAIPVPVASATSRPAPGKLHAPRIAEAPAAPPAAGGVEVCGHGRVKRSELDRRDDQAAPAWAQAMEARTAAERAALLARLAAGSTRQRVAAALLQKDVQEAAGLASSSTDSVAYRLALQACRNDASYRTGYAAQRAWLAASAPSGVTMNGLHEPGAVPTACAALSVERLEVLEPGSALPWLMRLADSTNQQDRAGTIDALYQVAQRPGAPVRSRLLTETVAEQLDTTPRPGETMTLSDALAQDQMFQVGGSFASVARACRAADLKDANRRQLCEQVARLMPERVRELLEARILYGLEERLGLAHSPQAMDKAEFDRLIGLMSDDRLSWITEPSCANFSRSALQIVTASQQGEVAYLRERLNAGPASAPR